MKVSTLQLRSWQVLVLAGVLGFWHVMTSPTLLPPFYFDNPSQAAFFFGEPLKVLGRVVEWLASGEIYRHLGITLFETMAAFVIGTGPGLAIGMWLALALDGAVGVVEERLMKWQPRQGETEKL